ncbi:MAG: 4Fe-4S dicluster domain-containing protein [Nitrososphaeria archaeon]|nr:4Fe-4S dicluster domain-containing protein [Nitrososphaeria archaeon]NIN53401.1 4Fe-4S dicluster domain-containing protein [Nitrososphaeria archaeon]NIQ33913.1 4Fe-4S dicluster domain-containing protein [Nitrososphaeria archaeon]
MNEERLYKGEAEWKERPMMGVIPYPGSSIRFKTGDWRTHRPVVDKDKCTRCLICWIYCPDAAIRKVEKVVEIDYDFCKGCGICAEECRIGAIEMVEE